MTKIDIVIIGYIIGCIVSIALSIKTVASEETGISINDILISIGVSLFSWATAIVFTGIIIREFYETHEDFFSKPRWNIPEDDQ